MFFLHFIIGVHGETPLHLAVFSVPHAPSILIKELLQAYPEATKIQDNDGDMPLHLATGNSLPFELFREIFLMNPEAALVKNCLGQIPLMYSWEISHIRLMVQRFPYIVLFEDIKGQSALTKFFDQLMYSIPYYIVGNEEADNLKNMIVRRRVSTHSVRAETVWEIICVLVQVVVDLTHCIKTCRNTFDAWRVPWPLHLLLLHSGCPFRFLDLSIHMFPEHVKQSDCEGNYPLHLAARMLSTHDWKKRCVSNDSFGVFTWRTGGKEYFDNLSELIRLLIQKYPSALQSPNKYGHIPLQLCSNTPWRAGVNHIVSQYPEGLHSLDLDEKLIPNLMQTLGKQSNDGSPCNNIFQFLRGRASIFEASNIGRLRRSARTRKRKLFSRTTYHKFFSS